MGRLLLVEGRCSREIISGGMVASSEEEVTVRNGMVLR